MARKPNHQFNDDERYRGQIESRSGAKRKAVIRREGWFIDAAAFILAWRLSGEEGFPKISAVKRFLTRRGWRSEQGMDISRTEVDRMLEDIDPSKCGLPKDKDEWDDAKDGKKEIPDAEITTIAIDPESWLAFRDAKLKGWQPSWRERTIKAGADTSDPKPKSQ